MSTVRAAALNLLLVLVLAVAWTAPAAAQEEPEVDTPAAELRVALGRLLAEHAFLTIEAMRTGLGDADIFAAAAEALEANTVELVATIESVYGADAASAFGDLWRSHIGYVVDYTRALSAGDTEGQQTARDQLTAYAHDFAELLASINPHLTVPAVESLLEDHIGQLSQVADLTAGDYASAYPAIRTSYAHMYEIGTGLAVAIAAQFPDRFPGADTMTSPAVNLRVALESTLGEHACLGVLAMRARLTDAPDAEAAREALVLNGDALERSLAAVYGGAAGRSFGELWDSHLETYLTYVDAVADGVVADQDAAREALRSYEQQLGQFLAGANANLSAADLERRLRVHVDQLVGQVDEYAAGEYRRSYQLTRDAYHHMGELGAGLASAIALQFPFRFPDTALPSPPEPALAQLAAIVTLAATLLVTARRRAGRRAEAIGRA